MINEKTFYGEEPKFNHELSKTEMIKAMNWYNYMYDVKQTKTQVIKYYKNHKLDSKHIKSVNENKFTNTFNICTIINNGGIIPQEHIDYLKLKLQELESSDEDINVDETIKTQSTIQDRIKNKAADILSQLEEYIDSQTEINFYDEFLKLNISNQLANSIINRYRDELEEINLAINKQDDQCVETYSRLSNKELKALRDYIQSIVDAANQIKNRTLKIKKVKAKKPMSRDKLISKLKYKVEDNNLKLISINPVDILEKEQLFIYNIEKRILTKYVAETNFRLGVKGTTIVNFSESNSYSKKIRKPEEFFKDFKKANKEFEKNFINIKATKASVNGRVSADCIILG